MRFERNIDGTNYISSFENADELHGYNNGDGTFSLEVLTWGKDKDGNNKQFTITLPRVKLGDFEVYMNNGDTLYTVSAR